jgi:hypothetical protein
MSVATQLSVGTEKLVFSWTWLLADVLALDIHLTNVFAYADYLHWNARVSPHDNAHRRWDISREMYIYSSICRNAAAYVVPYTYIIIYLNKYLALSEYSLKILDETQEYVFLHERFHPKRKMAV